ncbi:OmpA family protein [Saccharothrix stipae]
MNRLVAALTALVLSAAGTACVPEPPRLDRCEWMRSTDSPRTDSGRTVILVDATNSTRAAGQQAGAPDFSGVLREHVEQAVGRKDVVSIGSFSGPGAEPAWTASNHTADYSMANPENEKDRRKAAVTCLQDAVVEAARATPAKAGTDVLGALRAAADRVRDGRAGKTVVVASDGLPTSGCADLTHAGFDTDEEIGNIAQVCGERAEVRPDDFKDVRVVMRGIGRPSVDQPAPSPAQLRWLEQLWRTLCRANGATDQQCEITSGGVAGGEGTATTPAASDVPDPQVTYSRRAVTYEVPAAVLFDTSSAELRPDARSALARIAVDIRTREYLGIEVRGHTDSRADEQNSNALGQRRADAVAELLSREGLSDVVPKSFGESQLKCPDEFPGGVEDPVALQCNRRVEIVVTLA